MWHDKNTQSLCHSCYIFEYVHPHTFHVNFLLQRHITRGYRTSCTSYHTDRTDSKPFSRLIGPRHMTASRAVAHQSWVARCSLTFCNLAKAFKHYYIFDFHLAEVIKTIRMIHYCYCLMVYGKWRQIIYWKADYIMVLYQYCNWKTRKLMLTFNFVIQNCQRFVP